MRDINDRVEKLTIRWRTSDAATGRPSWGGHRGAEQLRPGDHRGVDTWELSSIDRVIIVG